MRLTFPFLSGKCERDAPVNDLGTDTAPVPEVAAPVDGEVESADAAQLIDDGPGEDDDVDPGVSAHATAHPHRVVTCGPTPKATANPPTRPTCAAGRITCLYAHCRKFYGFREIQP